MRSPCPLFSHGPVGDSRLRPAARNHPVPPILPDTIVQWTRLLTAGIMPRYVHRPVASDSSRLTKLHRERSQGRQA